MLEMDVLMITKDDRLHYFWHVHIVDKKKDQFPEKIDFFPALTWVTALTSESFESDLSILSIFSEILSHLEMMRGEDLR